MTSETSLHSDKTDLKLDQPMDISKAEETPTTSRPPISLTTAPEVDSINDPSVNQLYDDWLEFDAQLRVFETKHKEYVRRLDDVESLKTKYRAEFDKYTKKIGQMKSELEQLKKIYGFPENSKSGGATSMETINTSKSSQSLSEMMKEGSSLASASSHPLPSIKSSPSLDSATKILSPTQRLTLMSEQLHQNSLYLTKISDTLPRKNPYLKVILGSVDVSILNKADKWTYKQEYEKFKFIVTCISLVSSLIIWLLAANYRAFDALFHFLLVWYYCTLTIRESILIVNGSNINRWWRAHHFISTVATGILLTWPDSLSYHTFRTQFFIFSIYLSFVQLLQFYYQNGCLYRLRALGETHDMDITIEGFHRWMFRGLSFLVPFLLIGYLLQLYNAYALWQIAHLSTTNEWQVPVLAMIFFLLFLGNILTTLSVLREKLREKKPAPLLKEKYQSFKTLLSTNYRQRSRSNLQTDIAQHNESNHPASAHSAKHHEE